MSAPFELPPLPYAYSALEPAIDEATMLLHHGKHFASYTNKLNAAVTKLGDASIKCDSSLTALLGKLDTVSDESLRKALRDNGGGYLNHKQFFESMKSPCTDAPSGPAVDAITKKYGSMDAFQTEYSNAAKTLFGSGFVWLVKTTAGELEIRKYPNQDCPALDGDGSVPLLGLDVWEHA